MYEDCYARHVIFFRWNEISECTLRMFAFLNPTQPGSQLGLCTSQRFEILLFGKLPENRNWESVCIVVLQLDCWDNDWCITLSVEIKTVNTAQKWSQKVFRNLVLPYRWMTKVNLSSTYMCWTYFQALLGETLNHWWMGWVKNFLSSMFLSTLINNQICAALKLDCFQQQKLVAL